MTIRFVKHNPAFLDSEQLIKNFVARQVDLELLTRLISDNATESNQHLLINGPRGSGKTILVRRIAAEIEQHEALSNRFYPLIFSEESYLVSSAAEFWLEALFHLGRQTGDEQWKQVYLELRTETNDQKLCEQALQQLLHFADSTGKKILLIVENLNMLFGDMANEEEGLAICHTLMNHPRLQLLATATNLFAGVDHPSPAMFEIFRIHELQPLEDDECNAIWELIAGEKLAGEQIRPARILTGGNPRMLAILARCGAKRPFRQLLESLVDAIDEHTDYFKSHLDDMAPIERKVYLALAELWNISSVREIAFEARLDVNKTSAYLNRLISRGVIVIEKQAKRNKLYGVTEGIYNIYYLMRRHGCQAERVMAMVKFMISFYDPLSAIPLSSGQFRDFITAFESAVVSVSNRKLFQQCHDHFIVAEELPKSVPSLTDTMKHFRVDGRLLVVDDNPENSVLQESFNHAYELLEAGNYVEAFHVFDAIIMVYKSRTELQVALKVAGAMFGKGVALGNMERSEEAIKIFEDLIATYNGRFEAIFDQPIVMAMFSKGYILAGMNRPEEAITAYEEVIALYKNRSEERIVKWIVMSMLHKAVMLAELNRRDDAVLVYEKLIAMNKEHTEVSVAEQVIKGMIYKGVTLGELDRREEEIQTYEELIAVYKERTEVEISEHVVSALFNKGIVLGSLHREEEAIQTFEKIIATYNARTEGQIVVKVSNALLNKGIIYGKLERYHEAESAFMEAIALNSQRSRAQFVLLKLLIKMQERQKDALELAKQYVGNSVLVENTVEGAIVQFVELAALGYAEESLRILVGSPAERYLEPLVAALRLYTGEEVKSAMNILEVARDVVKKIEERQHLMN